MMARTKPTADNPSAKADTLKLRFSICSSCNDQHPTPNYNVHADTIVLCMKLIQLFRKLFLDSAMGSLKVSQLFRGET